MNGHADVSSDASRPPTGDGKALLSFAQQRLWFLERFEGGDPVFHLRAALELSGRLDAVALQAALDAVVARHESLRTVFTSVDGIPYQQVRAPRGVPIEVVDLCESASANTAPRLEPLYVERSRRPFDLAADSMIRAHLFRRSDENHVFLLVMHHIAADGWSVGILLRELANLYEAHRGGGDPGLPGASIRYVDFAADQHRRWENGALRPHAAFWKKHLDGAAAFLDLPTDHRRPAIRSSAGARIHARLPAALSDAIRELSRAEGCTAFMTLLAAYATLLFRFTGQEEVVVGAPVAGRTRADVDEVVGYFVNTLALRVPLRGGPSFRELLGRVRASVLGALTHQELPFEKLVEELQPERRLSHTPVFQTMLAFQNVPSAVFEVDGLVGSAFDIDCGTANCDLSLFVQDDADGFDITAEYSTELFEATTVERWMAQFETLLGSIVADAATPVTELELLTAGERRGLLEMRRTAPAQQSMFLPAHRTVEAQAARTPDSVAVRCEGRVLSYRELDVAANWIADRLIGEGVRKGDVVALLAARAPEMVAALLAILKSGAAYLPLDPDLPAPRIELMLEDADVEVLMAPGALRARAAGFGGRVLELELIGAADGTGQAAAASLADSAPGSRGSVGPDDLAYVIYTSGSTGVPKGVEIPHGALANFLASMGAEPGIGADDRLLAVTTLSFDISVLELLLPLTVGASVEIASSATSADPRRLLEALEASGATIMQATPSTWRLLIGAGWRGSPGLTVLCGGEMLPAELAGELVERAGAVWNMYGPTETTVWSTCWRVMDPQDRILVGKPIANTAVFVLDRHLDPVPAGVVAEVCIGGAGLARGYRNRPELSAQCFIEDPLAEIPGARLYRTGDLGRFDVDGNLEVIGRLDDQVKVRGFRIELGEIETVLRQHPSVAQAAAAVQELAPGDERLVVFLVPAAGVATSVTELRNHLKQRLPSYMLPQYLVELDELPTSPAGKLDRHALPKAVEAAPSPADHVEPRTERQRIVADIWKEALGIERVGIHDNFFELGGHSLLSARVVARLERATGTELSLRAIMLDTLEQIAAACDAQ